MAARPKKPKPTTRDLQPDDKRMKDWILGRGVDRSEFEACLASAARMTPTPTIEQIEQMIKWGWTAFGQLFFEQILEEAKDDRSWKRRDQVIVSARRIWSHVVVEKPPGKGGRPPKRDESRDRTIWVVFHSMLARARLQDPKVTAVDMRRRLVRSGGLFDLKNERELKEILMTVDASPGKKDRQRQLRMMLSAREKLRTKNLR
ncbi:MAG: hypothetical protein GEV13_10640 [Rhodospirillales bacterium]|nr:hypothetical protein [Rhodospirillales bacterium]